MTPNWRRSPFTAPSLSPSGRARPDPSERFVEERVLVGRADRYAYRLRRTEACERAHDHAFPEQCVEQDLSVTDHIGEQKVADRGTHGLEAVTAQDRSQVVPRGAIRGAPACELFLCTETRKRGLLPRRRQVEGAAHLADGGDDLCGPDAKADTQACETVDLREG